MSNLRPSFKTLEVFELVEVKLPGQNDTHRKFIPAHTTEVSDKGQIKEVKIDPHFRRGDVFSGNFVTRKFFVYPELMGRTIVVDRVAVVEKTDHAQGDKKTIILNISQEKLDLQRRKAKYRLKVGSPTGQFPIPGDYRFIKLEELTKDKRTTK